MVMDLRPGRSHAPRPRGPGRSADRADHRLLPLPWAQPVPLRVHGRTCREEAAPKCSPPTAAQPCGFAAVDERGAPRSHREGVLWHQPTAASPTGQGTIHHEALGSRVLLFVREQRRVDGRPGGVTEPFRCLGFATYEGHEGERPMAGDFSGVAAGAGDPGGVVTGDGVGGLRGGGCGVSPGSAPAAGLGNGP